MGMSVGGSTGGPVSDPNIVPLIDVLLVLIIIFMVITPTVPTGLPTLVPQPPSPQRKAEPPNPHTIVVQVMQGGKLMINQEQSDWDELGPRLFDIFKERAEKVAFVEGAEEVPFAQVARHRRNAWCRDRSRRPDHAWGNVQGIGQLRIGVDEPASHQLSLTEIPPLARSLLPVGYWTPVFCPSIFSALKLMEACAV
ncbi:MAG: biopolymer transporter ExbD [Candidatus Acidiferrales bacterium]